MSESQKVTNEIKVPNKDLEALRIHFPHCFDKSGNFQLEKFKNNLSENEINFSTESYGLDWLGKSYARLLASDPATTLLQVNETHNTKPENANSKNLLIKGDNLEVMKHLFHAYYEQVKMIYIDPPYNTGSDGFVYEDDRKFTVEELQQLIGLDAEKAKRILDFTKKKSNSHSAWLTFLYPRLYIAKQLLKDDGVIFVSIDDNEVAQLRLLMDEVFGEENFVGEIVRATGTTTDQGGNGLGKSYDFILVYSKLLNIDIGGLELSEKDILRYNLCDDKGKFSILQLRRTGSQDRREDRPNMFFPMIAPDGVKVYPIGPSGYESRWRVGKNKAKEMIEDDLIYWKHDDNGKWVCYFKYYLEGRTKRPSNLWTNIEGNKKAQVEIKSLFNEKIFDTPKPTDLVQKCIEISNCYESLVLDFFAGSGTTGDAIFQLNSQDGGNRKFILVQIPEPIDPKKNKTAYDFVKNELKVEPTIFEITKERLIRAAKKVKTKTIDKTIADKQKEIKDLEGKLDLEDKDDRINQLKAEIIALKEQDLGFKIYETMPIWEDYEFEAEQFDSSQTLFNVGKLTKDDIKALIITWKTYDGIALTQDLEKIDLNDYAAYYGNGKLYLMNKGFTTDHLKALLEKIDYDKKFNPTSIISFGYHFESKNLRELSENVKSYANKKNIDIDFITRY